MTIFAFQDEEDKTEIVDQSTAETAGQDDEVIYKIFTVEHPSVTNDIFPTFLEQFRF